LISDAVNKGVDETLGFVFVFATENGEQNFARGTRNGKISSAARDLKNGEQAQHRRDPNCDEANHAQHGQESERGADADPFQQTTGEEKLHEQGEWIHPGINVREESSARGTIVELASGDISLLKINKGRGDGIKEHEPANRH